MIKVVHITAHMSGGLARVLLSTLKHADRHTPEIRHEIVTLGEITPSVKKSFVDFENKLYINKSYDFVALKVAEADVVQIEYWNHPLIYKFLMGFKFPAARILSCCHVSGFYRPQIIVKNMVSFSDTFLAVTKATGKNEFFRDAPDNALKDKLRFIRFPVDVERFHVKRVIDKNQFNVGYIGTVGYSKLHKGFLRMCANIRIKNVKFIVCGEDNTDNIELESMQYNPELFEFTGFQENISTILEKIDVFGYPLNNTHFGSGEQAIIEAMYFGIPVVAFSNAAEAEIIENNVSGILVNTEEEYINAIEYLYQNPEERVRMGQNARSHVETRLNPQECFAGLGSIYMEMMLKPKTLKTYSSIQDDNRAERVDMPDFGAKVLIESLGEKGAEFLDSMSSKGGQNVKDADDKIANIELAMKTKTKGSLYQYLYFYPDDPYLNFWVGLVEQRENRHNEAISHFRKALKLTNNIERVKDYLNISLNSVQ